MDEVIKILEKKAINKKDSRLICSEFSDIDVETLLNLLVPDDELSNEVLNKYENTKENYRFIVYCCLYDKRYNVFINIMNKGKLYSNVLRKNFDDKEVALDYFNELSIVIKNNDLNSLSKILLQRLTN